MGPPRRVVVGGGGGVRVEFEVECIVGKKISRGVKEDGHRKGTAIYKVLA